MIIEFTGEWSCSNGTILSLISMETFYFQLLKKNHNDKIHFQNNGRKVALFHLEKKNASTYSFFLESWTDFSLLYFGLGKVSMMLLQGKSALFWFQNNTSTSKSNRFKFREEYILFAYMLPSILYNKCCFRLCINKWPNSFNRIENIVHIVAFYIGIWKWKKWRQHKSK